MKSSRFFVLCLLLAGLVFGSTTFADDPVNVALVLDVGGRGDLSFNDMGFKGADEAVADFGITFDTIASASAADYLPNVRTAALSGDYDLIIAVGFLLTDAVAQVASEYPNQKFMIIDSVVDAPNVKSIVFAENEGSALVCALMSMAAHNYGYEYVATVFGIEIPVLWHFEAGCRFGIDWANQAYSNLLGEPVETKYLYVYTGTFDDVTLGYNASQAFLAQGAGLIYNVAGPLGEGDLRAITEYLQNQDKVCGPPWMIGVDANQDYLGDGCRVLASMLKRVDLGVYNSIKEVVEGTFTGGLTTLGLNVRGVEISRYQDLLDFVDFGISAGAITEAEAPEIISNWRAMRNNDIPYEIWDLIWELEMRIVAGTVAVPNANTQAEIEELRAQYPLD